MTTKVMTMKKVYVKPELQVEEILLEGMLASSDPEVTNKPVIPLSNGRDNGRGGWGDLWD